MKTRIIKVNEKAIDKEAIRLAGDLLRTGGLVAIPTETVYGLGANALDKEAAKRTYAAKGRPSDNPLIVHIARMEDLQAITKNVPEKAVRIAERFWPGPLTMIFEKSSRVPRETTGGLDTVAVRMPNHIVAREVIFAGGGYISAPSANTSGRPSPTTAQHVAEDLNGRIELILDSGPVDIGIESTILDMTVDPPMILRPGAVTEEMLEGLVGRVEVDRALIDAASKAAPKAPGMKYRHYAPKAELNVVEGDIEAVIPLINARVKEKENAGSKVGVISTAETKKRYICHNVKSVGTREDARTIAACLYGILREFDADGTDYIYSESFDGKGIGSAVMNRLLKAAGHRVIQAEQRNVLETEK